MDMMREEGTAIGRFTAAHAVPHIVSKNGKFALMVDDAPYLILAGQANNSSNYPEFLPKVWPAIADMKANTLAMPVAWEQIEPVEGKFDFSFVDTLINQARARRPPGLAVVRHVEEHQPQLCAGLGQVG